MEISGDKFVELSDRTTRIEEAIKQIASQLQNMNQLDARIKLLDVRLEKCENKCEKKCQSE